MTLIELDRALRQLRLSGMAAVLEARLRQAQTERLAPSISSPRSSATNCSVGRTGCSSAGPSRPGFAIPTAASTASISISTRR